MNSVVLSKMKPRDYDCTYDMYGRKIAYVTREEYMEQFAAHQMEMGVSGPYFPLYTGFTRRNGVRYVVR